MDYLISYKFPTGTERKFKSTIGSILKKTYEEKKLIKRIGYGKVLADTQLICNEITEKLRKNKAIVRVEELEELPDSIKQLLGKKYEQIDEDNEKIEVPKKKNNAIAVEVREGFNILYGFFEWVKENNKKLLKNPRMYLNRLEQLDLDFIDKVHKGEYS